MSIVISVLVPVYNTEKYLERCLQSISAQTFQDFEIICVDDGSTDTSLSILQNYAVREPRLRVLSQKNTGVAATRNRLLQEANGKYISFIDADDWVEKEYLLHLYNAAQSTNADVVRGLFTEYNEKTKLCVACDKRYREYAAKRKEPQTPKQRIQAGLNDSQVWGKLILRELLTREEINFCTGCVAEDVSFEILLYLCARKIIFITQYEYFYRVGLSDSITANKLAMARGILLNLCFLSEDLCRRGFDLPEVYCFILKLMIKGIRRFRNIHITEQEDWLFQKTVVLIEKHCVNCYWFFRFKYSLFCKLTRGKTKNCVLRWSCFFH